MPPTPPPTDLLLQAEELSIPGALAAPEALHAARDALASFSAHAHAAGDAGSSEWPARSVALRARLDSAEIAQARAPARGKQASSPPRVCVSLGRWSPRGRSRARGRGRAQALEAVVTRLETDERRKAVQVMSLMASGREPLPLLEAHGTVPRWI